MPLKIAQVAPLVETVPPECYGGTERVVSYLTEELVRLGHDVTLFAAGGSQTDAKLVPITRCSLRSDPEAYDPVLANILAIERVFQRRDEFDIIHFHEHYHHFPLTRRTGIPSLTTVHGRLDLAGLAPLFREFSDIPLVSISDSQRCPVPFANWFATVYHGLPKGLYSFGSEPEDYLVFVGRICPEKRPDRAIALAKRLGMPLKVAAKVDKVDREYFESQIRPLLDTSLIDFIGEINEAEKNHVLGGARALIFPIDWPEPFGLVMIESLACGTPVIAFDCGSVSEVIEDGRTGFVVRSMAQAEEAIRHISIIDRAVCRAQFERRFSAERMAQDYLRAYLDVMNEIKAAPVPIGSAVQRLSNQFAAGA